MAVEGQMSQKDSRVAGADLTKLQYHFVTYDANGGVVAIDNLTDMPVGVLQNTPDSGETAELCVVGITKVSANAALATIGTTIGPSVDGQAEAKTNIGAAATDWFCGYTRGVSGGADELITCVVNCITPVPCGH